ncbi:MAG TPA: MFS transporter [Ktedonobacterales bacterium]
MSQATADTPHHTRRPLGALTTLCAEPAFARLLLGSFISGAGNWFNTVALLGLTVRLTGSPLAVGITLALKTLPQLLLAPVAGVVADHLPRKRILIVADLLAALVTLSFLVATSASRLWIIYAGTLALVVVDTVRSPARNAITPSIVAPDTLPAANALEGMADGSVMLLGAALGGLVSGMFGPTSAFLINSASFLASAALIATVRVPPIAADSAARGVRALTEVWPIVRASRTLQLLLLLATLWPIGGGAINLLLTVYPTQVFHAGDRGIGALYAAIGVGFLLGGFVAPRFARRTALSLTLAFIVEGILQIAVSQAPSLLIAVLALALATSAAGVGNACASTIIMRASPAHALGRVFALMGALSTVTFTLSLLASGVLLHSMSPRTLGALAGGLITCAGLAARVTSGSLLTQTETLPVSAAE